MSGGDSGLLCLMVISDGGLENPTKKKKNFKGIPSSLLKGRGGGDDGSDGGVGAVGGGSE